MSEVDMYYKKVLTTLDDDLKQKLTNAVDIIKANNVPEQQMAIIARFEQTQKKRDKGITDVDTYEVLVEIRDMLASLTMMASQK